MVQWLLSSDQLVAEAKRNTFIKKIGKPVPGLQPLPLQYMYHLYIYIYSIYIHMHSIYLIYLNSWIQRLPGSHDFHHQGAWDTAPAYTSPAPDWRSPPWRRLRRRVANVDTPNRRSPRRARPPVIKNFLETGIFMENHGKSMKNGDFPLPCLITRG